MMRSLLVLGLIVIWAFAVFAWPELPDQIPTHFNGAGQPDGWMQKSVFVWFLLPVLAALISAVFGWLLPKCTRAMARRNSQLLNMPQRARFRALPEEARVRAVGAIAAWLCWLGFVMQGLFGWIMYASNEVAHERWQQLPAAATIVLVVVVVASAIALAIAGSRAVSREIDVIELSQTR